MSVHKLRVVAADAGTSLHRWLVSRYAIPSAVVHKLLRTRRIQVVRQASDSMDATARSASPFTRLAAGDLVRVPASVVEKQRKEPRVRREARSKAMVDSNPDLAEQLANSIVWRDEHITVLNKPSGLAVHGGPGTSVHLDGMLPALAARMDQPPRLVHRLDKDTSGLLLLANSTDAAAGLTEAFRLRNISKQYHAVVLGRPRPSQGRVSMPLVKQACGSQRHEKVVPGGTAAAITEYTVVERAAHAAAWVELLPETGRTHQLRVHCSNALGTPILGDYKYGPGVPMELRPLLGKRSRLALHAGRIVLRHPITGRRLDLFADLPQHMQRTFDLFHWSTLYQSRVTTSPLLLRDELPVYEDDDGKLRSRGAASSPRSSSRRGG